MIARDLALTPCPPAGDYDLAIDGQDLAALVADEASVTSDVTSAIWFAMGEWFADLSEGVPWFQQLLGPKKIGPARIKDTLFNVINGIPGVTSVDFVNVAFKGRAATVTWQAHASAKVITGTVVSP